MKDASPALTTLLNEREYKMANLYYFGLRDGSELRFTDADIDLVYSGETFYAGLSLIGGGRLRSVRGLESDECEITITADESAAIRGIPLSKAAWQGAFDRAAFTQRRVFMEEWGDTSAGAVLIFSGEVSRVNPIDNQIRLYIVSDLHLLETHMPNKVYQPSCTHTFGDGGCGFNKAGTAVNSTATSGSTARKINSALVQGSGYWNLGAVLMTSGANAGLRRSVNTFASGTLNLLAPFPEPVAAGDTFTVTRGCNKSFAACYGYANTARFRGYPYIPVPETAV